MATKNKAQEIWKSIPGYEGRYEVSNLGRVRSVNRWVRFGRTTKVRFTKGKVLRICFNSDGYAQVSLGRHTGCHVHHLVAFAFIGPRPTKLVVRRIKLVVRHKNGNKSNNNLDNLCYGTRKENADDRNAHGTSNKGRRYIRARWLEDASDTKIKQGRHPRTVGERSN